MVAIFLAVAAIGITALAWARPRRMRELTLDRIELTDKAGNKTQIQPGIVAVSNGAVGAAFVSVGGDESRVVVENGVGVARLSASDNGPALLMQCDNEQVAVQPSGVSVDDGKSLAILLPKKVSTDLASVTKGAKMTIASAFQPRIKSKPRRGQEHVRLYSPADASPVA